MSQFIPQMGDRITRDHPGDVATVVGVNGHWFWIEFDDGRHRSYDNASGWRKVQPEVKP